MPGAVNKCWRNQRPDGSQYWVLSIDGKRYSTLSCELVSDIREGDGVEFSFHTSSRYRKVAAIARLSCPAFVTADKMSVSAAQQTLLVGARGLSVRDQLSSGALLGSPWLSLGLL